MEAMNVTRVVVEVLDAHGQPKFRHRFGMSEEHLHITLGRSALADVILDDAHAAVMHAAIDVMADGSIAVSDLGSRNGVIINGQRLKQVSDRPLPEKEFELGHTRIRVRTDQESLPPEQPDLGIATARGLPWMVSLGAILWFAAIFYTVWMQVPRDFPTSLATSIAGGCAVAAVWVTLWSLLSRMLQGRWQWLTHAAILFAVSALAFIVDLLLDIARFAFALPQFKLGYVLLIIAGIALLLYLHLINASALRHRNAMLVAVLLPGLVIGTVSWVQYRNQARNVNHIDVQESLYPPVLRLRKGDSVEAYFADIAAIRGEADRKRVALPPAEADDSEVAAE